MKVLILSTSERTGGAAIAARRLLKALCQNGAEAKMMVRDRQSDDPQIVSARMTRWPKAWERLRILLANRLSWKNLWLVDIACCGGDITSTPEFQEADVIHLHWVNQGFLSLDELKRIMQSGKRVVWTLHDQWPTTGVCHYSADCEGFLTGCRKCPQMKGSLPRRIFERKGEIYRSAEGRLSFVGCSRWIAGLAAKSPLTNGFQVQSVPNALPQDIFRPIPQQSARSAHNLPQDVRLILFSAFKVNDERKGFRYLAEAIEDVRRFDMPVALVVVGRQADALKALLPPAADKWRGVYTIPYVSDEPQMAALYAAADVFVTPSLQDNLPNTIAEAMSTGTPCVGFQVGGIPEMIDHKVNGYVARYRDAADLAEGIRYCLTHNLREAAAEKAARTYSEQAAAEAYINKVYRP